MLTAFRVGGLIPHTTYNLHRSLGPDGFVFPLRCSPRAAFCLMSNVDWARPWVLHNQQTPEVAHLASPGSYISSHHASGWYELPIFVSLLLGCPNGRASVQFGGLPLYPVHAEVDKIDGLHGCIFFRPLFFDTKEQGCQSCPWTLAVDP